MTGAAGAPRVAPMRGRALLPFLLGPLLLIGVLVGPALLDPGLFGDDLKTLISTDNYLTNLQSEARWLTHGWRVAVGAVPPWLAFQLCLLAWVAAAAITAEAMLGDEAPVRGLLLALALAANPGGLSFLMWPVSTLPVMLALLAGAVALRLLPQRPWVIFGAVAAWTALTALGHQLLALTVTALALLIVLGLAGREARPALRPLLLRLLAVLLGAGAGLMAGTLAGFALNAWRFGHFGVVVDAWRFRLLPGVEGPGLAAAGAGLRYSLDQLGAATGPLLLPVLLGGLALGLALVPLSPRAARGEAGARVAMAAGILLVVVAMPFATGLPLPELRGTMTAWIALAAIGGFALRGDRTVAWQPAGDGGAPASSGGARTVVRRGAGALLLVALVAIGLPRMTADLARLSRDEAANRLAMQAILRDLATTPPPVAKLVLLGAPALFTGYPGRTGWSWWVHYLMEYEAIAIFGRRVDVEYCPGACRVHVLPEAARALRPTWPDPAARHVEDGVVYLRIGE